MFRAIFSHEIGYWLKKPHGYFYFLVFFALAFVSFAGTAGFFDPESPESGTARLLNSPFGLYSVFQYFNKLLLFLLPAVIGAGIYRDYQYDAHRIMYSFPLNKRDFLFGRFLATLLIALAVAASVGLGVFAAEQLPGLHSGKIGACRPGGYLMAYGVFTIPNMLAYGAVVFAAVTRFRNIYAGFMVVVLLFAIQAVGENALRSQPFLMAIADPFAQNAVAYITQYWTVKEQNIRAIPLADVLILNRLLWLGLSALLFGVFYKNFRFHEHVPVLFGRRRKGARHVKDNFGSQRAVALPTVAYRHDIGQYFRTCLYLARFQLGFILRGRMFFVAAAAGILAFGFALERVTTSGNMVLLPVTRIVLQVPAFFFTGMVILLTFIYTGMLVQRERASRMYPLSDSAAVPGWVFLGSKVLAVAGMQALLLGLLMLAGVLMQAYHGYYRFEFGLYIFQLLVLTFINLITWTLAAVALHTFVSNTYLGIFLLLLGWLGVGSLPEIGITTRLLAFNLPPAPQYSDLNGYGSALPAWLWVESHWLFFGLLLILVAYLVYPRGVAQRWRERLVAAKKRLNIQVGIAACMLLLALVATGYVIHDEEAKEAAYTPEVQKKAYADFEKKYEHLRGTPQPRITAINATIELYPEENRFEASGDYTLINKSEQAIDTLLVRGGFDEISTISADRACTMLSEDAYFQFRVLRLQERLMPGDSMRLHFSVRNRPNTLFSRNSGVLRNGTYLRQDIFPRLGYIQGSASTSPADSISRQRHYQSRDADLIRFEAIIGTSGDQIAVAPGQLKRSWQARGRRYFHYQMDREIKFAFGIHSARFAVRRDTLGSVALEIYHHPGHEYKLGEMMAGLKAALAYNAQYFGPYQHHEARIIEFPQTEGTFATTSGNCIPMSEVRFIAHAGAGGEKTDLAFYTPAHEITHQWWGNQLMPADAPGAVMLTESIAEYVTLQVFRRHYGDAQALRFLGLQRQRYLKGRTSEQDEEPPLVRVGTEQSYIAYGKGALAFNALSHFAGETQINEILEGLLNEYRFRGPPYPLAPELAERLKHALPDSLQYLVTDLFETLTFHDTDIRDATLSPLPDGRFALDLSIAIHKYKMEHGREIQAPLSDYVEIGLFDDAGGLIAVERFKLDTAESKLRIITQTPAARVVVDPNMLLIGKHRAPLTPVAGTKF
ncbi:MAG: hypothetical protein H6565_16615 [Lewinellaceae bacterium]|nr:hypothetical protein [Lewinellaceae bacterium]